VRRRMTTRHALALLGLLLVAALATIEFQRWEEQRSEARSAKQEREGGEAEAPVDEEKRDGVEPPAAGEPLIERPEAVRRVDDTHELQLRIVALEAELTRLRAELSELRADLRAGDSRRRQIGDHLAANELVHAALWRDLYEAVLDGEAVTKDPTRVFAPLLALAEATGLGNAEIVEGWRRVRPEPQAECELQLMRYDGRWTEGEGADARVMEMSQVSFEVRLELRQRPADWKGELLSLSVGLSLDRRSDGKRSFRLDIDGPSSVGGHDSEVHLSFDGQGGGSIWRKPCQGDLDAHDLAPGEFHELLQKLITVYEELRTLAG